MKIAFILTQSLDSPSGLGRYGPLAREMVKLGYEVQIIALHHAWDTLAEKKYDESGVLINYVGQMHVRKENNRKHYYSPPKLLWISFTSTLKLAKEVFKSDADVLHLGKPQPFNVIAARLGKRNRPIYCDCDDYEAETNKFSNGWQKKIVRYFEDKIVDIASKLTTNTTFTRQRYIDLNYPSEDLYLIPNGVERSRFDRETDSSKIYKKWGIAPDAPLIMYVGTLGLTSHPVHLLLEAFKIVSQQLPPARLMLVGSGEDYDFLQEEAVRLEISASTIFTGRISPEAIPDYLAAATLSVDPIFDDLTAKARSPLKIIESLSVGTPIITSDVGDRAPLIKDQIGVLVAAGDSNALAEGIMSLLKDKQLRDDMSKRMLSMRDEWFWDKLVLQFVQTYEA